MKVYNVPVTKAQIRVLMVMVRIWELYGNP